MQRARVAVIGTGLIGGSILLRLWRKGFDVIGWDPDPATTALAAQRGIPHTGQLEEAVSGRDLAFLAGPLGALPQSLVEIAKLSGERCVLTDVGSTKSAAAEQAARHGLSHRFVAGHPMAGSERSGFPAADESLLDGCAWVLCPGDALEAFRDVARLLIEVFAARVVPMRPRMHDEVVALSSHVPHVFAGALAAAAARSPLRAAVLGLAAGSFKDGTRVAGTAGERIVDMLSGNREAVADQVRLAREVLEEIIASLDDEERLMELFAQGRGVRGLLDEAGVSTRTHRFASPAAELDFLLGLGERGGWITGCEKAVDGVAYTAVHTPGG